MYASTLFTPCRKQEQKLSLVHIWSTHLFLPLDPTLRTPELWSRPQKVSASRFVWKRACVWFVFAVRNPCFSSLHQSWHFNLTRLNMRGGGDYTTPQRGVRTVLCCYKSLQLNRKEEDKMFPSRKVILKLPIIEYKLFHKAFVTFQSTVLWCNRWWERQQQATTDRWQPLMA